LTAMGTGFSVADYVWLGIWAARGKASQGDGGSGQGDVAEDMRHVLAGRAPGRQRGCILDGLV